ncbi:MAG TPA: MBL fold metallo-hydrolase [Vicinamibacterales bacterium]|nr:MBL fold metallo-hydrolase [Vicinamibacterales bacterium]
MKITFLGAARTVTGSKHLLDTGSARVLVDCGLFQGLKALRERNWQPLPIKAADITAVVLTHAHLDHCGYLPRLVREGFRGRIFCTPGTQDLCRIVLPDSGRIQEEDAANANRHAFSKHAPALPLYTESDAFRALSQLQPVGYDRPVPVADGVEVDFINAGHLLGSGYARVRANGMTILFGGDLGRYGRPVLPDPTSVTEADFLLVESTYGNRVHEKDDNGDRLAQVIRGTADRGGKVIIPAFAIGRVEELLYWIKRLEDERRIPVLPVFVDSPMATEALARYTERVRELDPEIAPEEHDQKAPHGHADHNESTSQRRGHARRERQLCIFCTERFRTISSPQESKDLTQSRMPAIVISASGMATGGRVLHHLKAALPDPRNTALFVGFQAEGTRGRKLIDGAGEIKIHGRFIPVHARVERLDSMSAHADSQEIMRWLGGFSRPPKTTFLVHGELGAMEALQRTIASTLKWNTMMPEHEQTVELV